jgi:hypothetical protein
MELKPEKAFFEDVPCEEEEFWFLFCPNGRKERRERKAELFWVVVEVVVVGGAGEAATEGDTEEEYEGIRRRASQGTRAMQTTEKLLCLVFSFQQNLFGTTLVPTLFY